MKSILTFFLIVLTSSSQLIAQQKPKRRPGGLYVLGPARTVRIEQAQITNINGEFVEGPRTLVMTIAFNEDGTNAERTYYHEGTLISRNVETYDPDGRLLEASSYDGRDVLRTRAVKTYDAKGRWLDQTVFRGDGSMSNRIVFRYDGEQRQSESFIYDLHGGVVASTTSKVTVVGERNAGRDLRERQIESVSLNPRGTISTRSSIASKDDGSQEFKQERSDGTWERSINSTDGKGGGDHVEYRPDGSILFRRHITREFDSHGNPFKVSTSQAKGDSQDFEPTQVFYWTVTYYPVISNQ